MYILTSSKIWSCKTLKKISLLLLTVLLVLLRANNTLAGEESELVSGWPSSILIPDPDEYYCGEASIDITVDAAPMGATVTKVEIWAEVDHPAIDDVEVVFSNQGGWVVKRQLERDIDDN